MPLPLAHPVAALPLRRFCPRYLDFSALVIGSIVPDAAYAIDDLNKFSRTLVYVFGPTVEKLSWVRKAWDWDDFSHAVLGSVGFCLPLGLFFLWVFFSLRGALVTTLPNPHRDALLPLCDGPRCSMRTGVRSLLVGIWIHIAWDSLTNGDRWLGQHWAFLHWQIDAGVTKIELCRVFWLFSSLGGMLVLMGAYLKFLKRGRSTGWLYQPGELTYYLLWLTVFALSAFVAIPLSLQFASFRGTVHERLTFLHRFAGYYIAALAIGMTLLALGSVLHRHRLRAGRAR